MSRMSLSTREQNENATVPPSPRRPSFRLAAFPTIPMGVLRAMPVNACKSHFCTITYVRGVLSKRGQNGTYRRQKRSNPDAFAKKDAKTDAFCLTHLHIFVAHPCWRYQKGRFTGSAGPKRGSNRGSKVVNRSFAQTLTSSLNFALCTLNCLQTTSPVEKS